MRPVQTLKLIADNKRARFDYYVEDTYDAGIVLTGTEVKSLRLGRATIGESYVSPENGEVWLINCYIPEYGPASQFNHEPRRKRKLLLKEREINKLFGAVDRDGRTVVPLKMFFNERGMVKLEIALAKGKKDHDKREATKNSEWKREQSRIMRDRG
jgi:SsrA-binding protein